MELLEGVELLADADELDRLAGDRLDAEGRAAARVAVELGEDHAVNVELGVELVGAVDGVLAGHRVADEEDLLRLRAGLDVEQLRHQLFVNVEAAGGVEDHDVAIRLARGVERAFADAGRAAAVLGVDRHVELLAEHAQLLDGGGALHVRRDEHGRWPRCCR